jgi:hypothetical protein
MAFILTARYIDQVATMQYASGPEWVFFWATFYLGREQAGLARYIDQVGAGHIFLATFIEAIPERKASMK